MPSFFTNPSKKLFEHAFNLSLYSEKGIKFNPQEPAHTKLIEEATSTVKEKLKALQSLDTKIATSFSLGVVALGFSYILPVGLLAGGCFAYGAYQMGQRKAAYAEYTSALENLAKCCNWSLGNVELRNAKALEENETIKGMISTLAPLTSAQHLRDFIDDKVENLYVEQAEVIKQETTFLDHHLNKEENQLYFKIYGYKQGNFLDILQGIAYGIKNSFRAISQAFTRSAPTEESMTPVLSLNS